MSLTKLSLAWKAGFSGYTNVANGQFRQLLKEQPLGIGMVLEIMRMVSSSEFTNLVKGLSHELVIG
jgi:hypothetical protein